MPRKNSAIVILAAFALATVLAGAYLVRRKNVSLAPVSRQVAAPVFLQSHQTAVAPPVPAASIPAAAETVAAAPAVSAKIPDALKKPAAFSVEETGTAKPALVFLAPGLSRSSLNAVRLALATGNAQSALDALKSLPAPAEGSDGAKEAAVLEGRALLELGNVEHARKIFEPLAFASVETERGADALFGNFVCQAGTLQRCRDSELEQVLLGAKSWGAANAAMEAARRAEDSASGDSAALEKARRLYQLALETGKLDDGNDARCLARLTELTNKIVLDAKVVCATPKPIFHKVESGDSVERIAKKYKVNQGQIKIINKLNDKLVVRLGQNLKMLPGDVVYKVSRTHLHGTLYIDGVFIRRYPVGIGPGDATPIGTYAVERKAVNPDWYYDGKRVPYGDPANILGTRWMAFAGTDKDGAGLGLHGTSLPESVPGRESKGCVRMRNSHVEEIYDLMPQGGKVEIAD